VYGRVDQFSDAEAAAAQARARQARERLPGTCVRI